MDVTDSVKDASRKRMNTDAEHLGKKVSRETAKNIKLTVAQDTVFWDLNERQQQLAGAHERLQQNMVEVQMQHEAASAQYATERRLRLDTLNKMAGARGVCDVLEENDARLQRCVASTEADRAALQAAHQAADERVRDMAAELERTLAAAAERSRDARESGARAAEAARQLAEAREQLGAARAAAAERAAARDQLAAHLRQADEAAAGMCDEVARLVRQYDTKTAHMQQSIKRQEDEARAEGAGAERLHSSVSALADELRRVANQLADANITIDHMKVKEAAHIDEIQNLEKVMNDKNQKERDLQTEINSIKECVRQLETDKLEAQEQLNKSAQECGALLTALEELSRTADSLRASLALEQQQRAAQRDADAARLAELRAAAAAKDRDLDANTGTIARLKADLRAASDARAREQQQLRDATARLDLVVKAKDDELGAQMTIIFNMRSEKERLQERIQGMQNTLDNIQKELTGRLVAPELAADASEPPELDAGPLEAEPRRPVPRKPESDHGGLFSFLSDDSMDDDLLDPREAGQRSATQARGVVRDARGERRSVAQVDARLHKVRGEHFRAVQGSISLSQERDDLKIKNRTFFKNKRFDSKPKKTK